MSDGALATASARLLPAVARDDDSPAPLPANEKRTNGHVSRGELVEGIDLTKVSRSTTAALLIAARRLARG